MNLSPETIRSEQIAWAQYELQKTFTTFYMRLARKFIEYPDDLKIETTTGTESTALTVTPHPDDAGKLLGAKGVMFHSWVTVLSQLAKKHRTRIHYRQVTTPINKDLKLPVFMSNPQWQRTGLHKIIMGTCDDLFDPGVLIWSTDDEDKTKYKIELNHDEPRLTPDAELMDALSKLFHACGRANGRLIYLDSFGRGKP